MSKINRQSDNIKVEGRRGTWYVTREITFKGRKFYELESEQYGDLADHIIINENGYEQNEDASYAIMYEYEG